MKPFKNYIATWFYRESHEEASYYPQAGGRGDSALLHSVYMQIQVPFFTTFRHYNPEAELLFFTNLEADQLPPFLTELFQRTRTEVVTLPYRNRPPKGWYKAWMNQFYVYDIFKEMERRMQPGDTLLVCDADCLYRTPLHSLFQSIRTDGSALYDLGCPQGFSINGTTLAQMEEFYTSCYGERPSSPMAYYGGECTASIGNFRLYGNLTSTCRPIQHASTKRLISSVFWPNAYICVMPQPTAM